MPTRRAPSFTPARARLEDDRDIHDEPARGDGVERELFRDATYVFVRTTRGCFTKIWRQRFGCPSSWSCFFADGTRAAGSPTTRLGADVRAGQCRRYRLSPQRPPTPEDLQRQRRCVSSQETNTRKATVHLNVQASLARISRFWFSRVHKTRRRRATAKDGREPRDRVPGRVVVVVVVVLARLVKRSREPTDVKHPRRVIMMSRRVTRPFPREIQWNKNCQER